MKKAFTLTELLVGLLVGLMLMAGMATFLGDVSYTFQEHKAVTSDRSQLQQSMMTLTRDLMFIGQEADENGAFDYNGDSIWFIDATNDGDATLGTSLTYYRVYEDMDYAASADGDKTFSWLPVTYAVDKNVTDPVTRESLNILRRNGEPFLLGVSEFSLAFGVDTDDDGLISDTEWVSDVPTDELTKNEVYGGLRILRITLARETQTADGRSYDNRLVREIHLRNR